MSLCHRHIVMTSCHSDIDLDIEQSSKPIYTPENHYTDSQSNGEMKWPESASADLSKRRAELEKAEIEAALNQFHGNRARAAVSLGISRSTLWRKIDKYELPKKKYIKT